MVIIWLIPLALTVSFVFADTEVLNFRSAKFAASCHTHIDWPVLSKSNDSRILTTIPISSRRVDRYFPGEQSSGLCSTFTYDGNDGKIVNTRRDDDDRIKDRGGKDGQWSEGGERNEGNKVPQGNKGIDSVETVCEGDTWLLLDLDQWFSDQDQNTVNLEDKPFTLRISWPASTPADFKLTLFQPPPLSSQSPINRKRPDSPPRAKGEIVDIDAKRAQQTRDRETQTGQTSGAINRCIYARVRSSTAKYRRAPNPDGSILPFQFSFLPKWFLPALVNPASSSSPSNEIRFHILLEPLVLGAIPQSLLPGAAGFLCLLVILVVFVIPRVNAGFAKMAGRVRKGKGRVKIE